MASITPTQNAYGGMDTDDGNVPQNGYGDESSGQRSGVLSNFPFITKLTEKKVTRDGQPPKRRGPKPDSKPALTRRQELNRQAQRTHRERKELYIKALEQEVLRLKDVFTTTARERDAVVEENRRLKELLAAHGITFDLSSPGTGTFPQSSYTGSTNGSVSGYGTGSASTGYTSPASHPPLSAHDSGPIATQQHATRSPGDLDYDQIGIDFVLTLERPCMDHMQMLLVRSDTGGDEDISGHAMMASAPPESHIHNHPDVPYPSQMPSDVRTPDLLKLLDLSNRLPLDGEITPVMAWAQILQHPRFPEIQKPEFTTMKDELLMKVRCYGFGAVLEEFEVRDALQSVFANKDGVPFKVEASASDPQFAPYGEVAAQA